MTYSTLLVTMNIDDSDGAVLQVAADLAGRLNSTVIGIAACNPMQIVYANGYGTGNLIEQDRAQKASAIKAAEAQFRAVLGAHVPDLQWRSSFNYAQIADTIAENARVADLVLIGPAPRGAFLDTQTHIDVGALVIQLGRPALIVPHGTGALALKHVMIAWKDTRETRRAVVDALPLLRLADRVTVAQVAASEDVTEARTRLSDVVAWLGRHGLAANLVVAPAKGDDMAGLDNLMDEHGVTFLVAGAYGHNRLREWALGGVTRQLLTRPSRCTLLSH